MAKITVLRPDVPEPESRGFTYAPRASDLPERITIGLVVNGKPFSGELLELLAAEVGARLRRTVDVERVQKRSSAYPIDDDQALLLAARSHLVLTGIGD